GGCYGGYSCGGCCGGMGYGGGCGGCWGCHGYATTSSCMGCGGGCYGGYAFSGCCGGGYATPGGPGMYMVPPGGPPPVKTSTADVPIAVNALPSNRGQVVVYAPADAKLFADGQATTLNGTERVFQTPELLIGRDFQYTLKIE